MSVKKERGQHTKNISFNLSINNFAYIKNADRSQYHSPLTQAILEPKKKKESKRVRTHAEEQLLELAHSLSPGTRKGQGQKEHPRRE